MNETIHINLNDLETEKAAVKSFFKKQVEAFYRIKCEVEKVQWDDANYDALVDSLNAIGSVLSEALQKISNGNDVYVLSELIPIAEDYLEKGKLFPKI